MQPFLPFMMPDEDSSPTPDRPDLFGMEEEFLPVSSGSGVILSSDGYILTNHHVITRETDSATKVVKDENLQVTVVLDDGTEVSGDDVTVVYSHPLADLALLKINRNGLKPIRWGDSDKLRIGEAVAAIGSPLDLRATITSGIVGAKGRSVLDMSGLIQTNAVINPGSSGGALINLDGELVGINRLISTNTGRWQGYGFAIPSNDARWFFDQVIEKGKVEFGFMGISMYPEESFAMDSRPTKREMMATLNIPLELEGVLIDDLPDSPSGKPSPSREGGLEIGDYITRIDDQRIRENSDLLDYVKRQPVGKKIDVTVTRQNKSLEQEEKTFTITLSARPDETDLRDQLTTPRERPRPRADKRNEASPLGMTLEPATESGTSGLKVVTVTPGSPADQAGLKAGDLLTELNRQPLKTMDDLVKGIEKRPESRAHRLDFLRDGRPKVIPLNPAQ
jgi:serine protease Do